MKRVILVACMALLPTAVNAQATSTTFLPRAGGAPYLPEGRNFPFFVCSTMGTIADPDIQVTVGVDVEFMGSVVASADPQSAQGTAYASVTWSTPSPNTFSGDTNTTLACHSWAISSDGQSAADYKGTMWQHAKFSWATPYNFDNTFFGPPWHWLEDFACHHRVADSGRWSDYWTFDSPFSLVATITGYDHHLIVVSVVDDWYPWALDFTQDLSVCNYLQVQ